jgi:hypothetical protein
MMTQEHSLLSKEKTSGFLALIKAADNQLAFLVLALLGILELSVLALAIAPSGTFDATVRYFVLLLGFVLAVFFILMMRKSAKNKKFLQDIVGYWLLLREGDDKHFAVVRFQYDDAVDSISLMGRRYNSDGEIVARWESTVLETGVYLSGKRIFYTFGGIGPEGEKQRFGNTDRKSKPGHVGFGFFVFGDELRSAQGTFYTINKETWRANSYDQNCVRFSEIQYKSLTFEAERDPQAKGARAKEIEELVGRSKSV